MKKSDLFFSLLLLATFIGVRPTISWAEHDAPNRPSTPAVPAASADTDAFNRLTTPEEKRRFAREWKDKIDAMDVADVEVTGPERAVRDFDDVVEFLYDRKKGARANDSLPHANLPKIKFPGLSREDHGKIYQLCQIRGAGALPYVYESLDGETAKRSDLTPGEIKDLKRIFGTRDDYKVISLDAIAFLGPDNFAARKRREFLAPIRALDAVCKALENHKFDTSDPKSSPGTGARLADLFQKSQSENTIPLNLVDKLTLADARELQAHLAQNLESLTPPAGVERGEWRDFTESLVRALHTQFPDQADERVTHPRTHWQRERAKARTEPSRDDATTKLILSFVDVAARRELGDILPKSVTPSPPYSVTQLLPEPLSGFLELGREQSELYQVYARGDRPAFDDAYRAFQARARAKLDSLRSQTLQLAGSPRHDISPASWTRWLESVESHLQRVGAIFADPVPPHQFNESTYRNELSEWLKNPDRKTRPSDSLAHALRGEDRDREVIGRLDAIHQLLSAPETSHTSQEVLQAERRRLGREFPRSIQLPTTSLSDTSCGLAKYLGTRTRFEIDEILPKLNDCQVVLIRDCLDENETEEATYLESELDRLFPSEAQARQALLDAKLKYAEGVANGLKEPELRELNAAQLRAESTLYASAFPRDWSRATWDSPDVIEKKIQELEKKGHLTGSDGSYTTDINKWKEQLIHSVVGANRSRAVPNSVAAMKAIIESPSTKQASEARLCGAGGLFASQYKHDSPESGMRPVEIFRMAAAQDSLSEEDARRKLTTNWLAKNPGAKTQTDIEMMKQVDMLRAEFEQKYAKLTNEQRRRLAPWLYDAKGEYFTQEALLDERGELRVSFVPTAKLRKLQLEQALAAGDVVSGVRDENYYRHHRVSPFSAPSSAEESQLWWTTFGDTPPEKLRKDITRSGALESSNLDLALLVPGAAVFRGGMLFGRGLLGAAGALGAGSARVASDIAINYTIAAMIEGIAKKFGPAAGLTAGLAPVIAIIARRPIIRLFQLGAPTEIEASARMMALLGATEREAATRLIHKTLPGNLTAEERVLEAEKLLGRKLKASEREALERAHLVGAERPGAGHFSYTPEEIKQKIRELKRAFPNRQDRKDLLLSGLAGKPGPVPQLPKNFAVTGEMRSLYSAAEEVIRKANLCGGASHCKTISDRLLRLATAIAEKEAAKAGVSNPTRLTALDAEIRGLKDAKSSLEKLQGQIDHMYAEFRRLNPTRDFPYGFGSKAEYERFGKDFQKTLRERLGHQGQQDIQVFLGGSANEGLSFMPKWEGIMRKPFGVTSDLDMMVIVSPGVFKKLFPGALKDFIEAEGRSSYAIDLGKLNTALAANPKLDTQMRNLAFFVEQQQRALGGRTISMKFSTSRADLSTAEGTYVPLTGAK